MFDILYLGCAAVASCVLAYKLLGLREAPSATLTAVCLCTGFPTLAFACAAPTVYELIGRVSGIPDLATLFVYGLITCFSGSARALALLWTPRPAPSDDSAGPAHRPRLLRRVAVFAAVLALMAGLFTYAATRGTFDTGPHPLDFDTTYAPVPALTVFLLVYQAGFAHALLGISRACGRHAKDLAHRAPGLTGLRTGVRLIAHGCQVALGYCLCKCLAIGAAATARPGWDALSTVVGPLFASAGAMLIASGFVYPALRAWAARRRDFLALRPLWLAAARADRHLLLDPLPAPARHRLAVRDLKWRTGRCITEIRDAQLTMRVWEDPAIGTAARRLARKQGLSAPDVAAAADAAALLGALRARDTALDRITRAAVAEHLAPAAVGDAVRTALAHGLGLPPAPRTPPPPGHRGELDHLIRVSRALDSAPVTEALHRTEPSRNDNHEH
ncbi:DUF6545 domain-containing protein [Streptomyces gamaensis]|uniref:DUF6545 domain-containing protein n=1 Tax=Streptomyces gamaensis TaxID=1763542 RepID=A0ABW0YVW5_9ACTN